MAQITPEVYFCNATKYVIFAPAYTPALLTEQFVDCRHINGNEWRQVVELTHSNPLPLLGVLDKQTIDTLLIFQCRLKGVLLVYRTIPAVTPHRTSQAKFHAKYHPKAPTWTACAWLATVDYSSHRHYASRFSTTAAVAALLLLTPADPGSLWWCRICKLLNCQHRRCHHAASVGRKARVFELLSSSTTTVRSWEEGGEIWDICPNLHKCYL